MLVLTLRGSFFGEGAELQISGILVGLMSVWEDSRGEGISICLKYKTSIYKKKMMVQKKLRGKNVGSQRVNMGVVGLMSVGEVSRG